MRVLSIVLLLFILQGYYHLSFAQNQAQDLMNLDRQFAKEGEAGIESAFKKYLTPDALRTTQTGFATGQFSWPDSAGAQLSWQPAAAEVAAQGDFGYTIGTWRYGTAAKPPLYQGGYLELWEKQGGTWQVTADVGVQFSSLGIKPAVQKTQLKKERAWPDSANAYQELAESERRFATRAADKKVGLAAAYSGALHRETGRLCALVTGSLFAKGALAKQKLTSKKGTATVSPIGIKMAASADMALAWGQLLQIDQPGFYVRMYRRDPDGFWRIIVEMLGR